MRPAGGTMADYYSILKKTIASLPESNGAARRGVYSRARNAIVTQLKSYEPPLSPSEITTEQLRLEEAIRKVEAEAARESLGIGVPKPPSTASENVVPPAEPVEIAETSASAEDSASTTPPQMSDVTEPSVSASPLKKVVEDAGKLGAASQKAVKSTKEVLAPDADAPGSVPTRREPLFSPSKSRASEQKPPQVQAEPDVEREVFADTSSQPGEGDGTPGDPDNASIRNRHDRPHLNASDALKARSSVFPIKSIALVGVLVLIVVVIASVVYSQKDMIAGMFTGDPDASGQQVVEDTPGTEGTDTVQTPGGSDKNADRLLGGNGEPAAAPDARAVTTTVITPGETAADASPARTPPSETSPADTPGETIVGTSQPVETTAPEAPGIDEAPIVPETAIANVEAPSDVPVDASPGAAERIKVAQRSILYEEGEEANGAGTASQGEVVWALEEEIDLEGRTQAVLTASVQIAERDVTVNLRIKPNDDTSLPASHLVEIKYQFPENFPAGDVQNVPGLVMKPTEEARGDALLGASVKVSPGYFWIALSSISSERERNMGLLRERGWIDVPMLYDNGKRGILTLEKGATGTDAVNAAVAAWQAG